MSERDIQGESQRIDLEEARKRLAALNVEGRSKDPRPAVESGTKRKTRGHNVVTQRDAAAYPEELGIREVDEKNTLQEIRNGPRVRMGRPRRR